MLAGRPIMESAAESSNAPQRQTMPGTLNVEDHIEDYIDFYENPFDILGPLDIVQDVKELKEEGRKNTWSVSNLAALDLENTEGWHVYDPPEVLHETPDATSDTLLDIVALSIENIRAQAAEVARQKEEEEERRKQEDARNRPPVPGSNDQEPYLPVIISLPSPPPSPHPDGATPRPSNSDESILTLRRAEALRDMDQDNRNSSEADHKSVLRQLFLRHRRSRKGKEVARPLSSTSSSDDSTGHSFTVLTSILEHAKSLEPKTPIVEPVECVSCLDEFPPKKTVRVPCHNYCFECFAALISTSVQNEQQWPPKCCLNEIPVRTILRYVPENLKAQFEDRSSEFKIPAGERVYCAHVDCGVWIKPDRLDPRDNEGRCEQGHWTCTLCHGPSHRGEPCPQDKNLNLTNQLAEEQGWKHCGRCQALVEHRDACQHMTCRCGYQFCYVCSKRWRTCKCTQRQLNAIKEAAAAREAERLAREAAEAEELRHALAQIQELERSEALRAEMQRQEEERMEEERRQRELEERVLRESIRRRDLEIRFAQLKKELGHLHELQLVMLEQRHDESNKELVEESVTSRRNLAEKQEQERVKMDEELMVKMGEKDRVFIAEYFERSRAENKILEDYGLQLQEYWRGRPDGEAEVEKAMAPLHKKMEDAQLAWRGWKDAQLKEYGRRLRDRQQIKEEYMYSARARLEDQLKEKEEELVRRTAAERKWTHMVVLERERLLAAKEVEEVEGDADSLFTRENAQVEMAGEGSGASDGEQARSTPMGVAV